MNRLSFATQHFIALICAVVLMLPVTTSAQEVPSFQAENFEPMPAQGLNILNIGTSEVLGDLTPSAGLFFHYVDDSVVIVNQETGEVTSRPVDAQFKTEVWGAFGLFDIASIGFVLPIIPYQTGDTLTALGRDDAINSFAFGDLRLVPKVQILDPEDFGGFGVGFTSTVYLPVGDDQSFNSDGGFRLEPRLNVDWRHPIGFTIAANVGYQLRPENQVRNIVSDDMVRWGGGVEIPTGLEGLQVIGSVFGNVQLAEDREATAMRTFGENNTSPIEALGGLQYQLPFNLVASAGAGTGLNDEVGSPNLRVFASIGYTPMNRDSDDDGVFNADDGCPDEPEDKDGFQDSDGCPDPDNDKDGIADADDSCPDKAEDVDGFEDKDGCPDPDNDSDGIADAEDKCPDEAGVAEKDGCPIRDKDSDGIVDAQDKCPEEPEDKDGFEDKDGCPDPDNDGDGIADAEDKCPDEAELVNGIEDEDGCPEKDTDGDGIIDPEDDCVDEAETYNGNKDEDGCPDGDTTVVITKTEIKILQKVFFSSGKATIQSRSYPLLDTVATVLKQNPQVSKLLIAGHTDDVGDEENNLELSRERAAAVREYLTDKGVAAERLESEGYGESKPLCEDMEELLENRRRNRRKIKQCRADNRRVEFKILEVNGKPVDATDSVTIEEKEVVEEPVDGEESE